MEKSKFPIVKKDEIDLIDLNWVYYQTSKLTIWHRPKASQIPILQQKYGLTYLLTLQSEKEKLKDLQIICKKTGVIWLHVPLEGANLPLLQRKESKEKIIKGLQNIMEILYTSKNATILIHCAAGIHRTGVFTYSLFRMLGYVFNYLFF